ncbi:MAG: hypothetical protein AAF205_00295 [Pseudomonadota bacterium]
MAEFFAREARFLDKSQATSAVRASARESNGKVYVVKATIDLAAQTNASGDTHVLGQLPVDRSFLFGQIVTTVSLGTSTVSIGTRATPALFRAAGTFTTTNVPTNFGAAAAVGATPVEGGDDLLLTVATAGLPATGTVVVTLYFVGP